MTTLSPIAIASPAYFALAALVVASAHLAGGRFLAIALCLSGAVLAASWLTPAKAVILALMLAPHWVATRWYWNQPDRGATWVLPVIVAWLVTLLMATKIAGFSADFGISGVVGVSYIAFRQVQLLIEAPAAKTPFSSLHWFGYLINPLTLIAGPIQNWKSHIADVSAPAPVSRRDVLDALHRIATGLLKISLLAPIFAGQAALEGLLAPQIGWFDVVVTFYAYYIFLFLDFSGYIDVVIGVAHLAGFRHFPENFNRPYLATNFQDFWGRWNITLGQWFRAFVFTPLLTIGVRGLGRPDAVVPIALFITFLLVGLWHGIAWNFVLFGFIQATGVTLTYFYRQALQRRYGKSGLKAYEENKPLLVVRTIIFQHMIAASFLLLDNQVATLVKVIKRLLS